MNSYRGAELYIVLLLLSTCAFSQTTLKKLEPDTHSMPKDWEVYYTKIPVSGGVRVGVMAFETRDKIAPASFFVKIPQHTQSKLCVEISSRDGRYQAKVPYAINGFEPGVYELSLPTKYRNELKNYTIRDITILAKIVKTCDQEAECYVLSAWNKPSFSNQQVYIYLNSEQFTELVLVNPRNSTEHIIECETIVEPITTAYNCLCKVSGYNLSEFSDVRIKRTIRKVTTRYFDYLDLPVRF